MYALIAFDAVIRSLSYQDITSLFQMVSNLMQDKDTITHPPGPVPDDNVENVAKLVVCHSISDQTEGD